MGAGLASSEADAAGLLTPTNHALPELSIQDHRVSVVIEEGYAVTTVDQIFKNPHNQDLTAIYSFPVPEKAAVAQFTYWIDGKPIHGEVLPKQEAKAVYEAEKKAGREAGLMEKQAYKTFDVSVWPVRATSSAHIRLKYIQSTQIDTGMGRYLYPLEEGGVDENKTAFWTANDEVIGHFSFDLTLRSTYPVEAMALGGSLSAPAIRDSDGNWKIHLDNGQPAPFQSQTTDNQEDNQLPNPTQSLNPSGSSFHLNQDIVTYWRQKKGLPGSVDLTAYKAGPNKTGTFQMTFTPGDDLKPIQGGQDWVFVLDKSGSMRGKFLTLADGITKSLQKMRRDDRFRLILFDQSAFEITNGFTSVTAESVSNAIAQLRAIKPGSGTNLYNGLERGLTHLDSDRPTGLILVTDGVANVGNTEKKQFLDLLNKQDVRLFTLVMGNSANRPLLESLTKASNGFSISLSNNDDIIGAVLSATAKATHNAFRDVTVTIDGVKAEAFSPQRIGTIYRGQSLNLLGHYRQGGTAVVTLTANVNGEKKVYKTQFDFPDHDERNPELERIWAYATLQEMDDNQQIEGESDDRKQAQVDLASQYGLVTDHTSMVVVREEAFQRLGITRNNAKRIEKEQNASQQRQIAPIQSRRVDTATPLFSSPRPSHSGGGSSGPLDFALYLLFVTALLNIKKLSEKQAT
ncbi:MAG: VWA domain-containing protein [Magnetococcales bacterium]|nr:VWA domain-containing protein [Magnetococcales bacterium]